MLARVLHQKRSKVPHERRMRERQKIRPFSGCQALKKNTRLYVELTVPLGTHPTLGGASALRRPAESNSGGTEDPLVRCSGGNMTRGTGMLPRGGMAPETLWPTLEGRGIIRQGTRYYERRVPDKFHILTSQGTCDLSIGYPENPYPVP